MPIRYLKPYLYSTCHEAGGCYEEEYAYRRRGEGYPGLLCVRYRQAPRLNLHCIEPGDILDVSMVDLCNRKLEPITNSLQLAEGGREPADGEVMPVPMGKELAQAILGTPNWSKDLDSDARDAVLGTVGYHP